MRTFRTGKTMTMRVTIAAAVLALTAGAALAAPKPAVKTLPPTPAARTSSVLAALLAGRDARPAIAQALAEGRPQAAAALHANGPRALGAYAQDLQHVAAALRAARQSTTPESGARTRAALRAALAMLPGQRLLLDARIEQIDASVAQMPAAAAQRWRDRRAALLADVAGIEAAARDLDAELARIPVYAATPQALLAELTERLARALPDAAPAYGAALPVSRLRFPTRAPATSGSVVPSYADSEHVVEPVAADAAATEDAPLSSAILAQAASLGHDYTRIFDFVRSHVRTEFYAGAQKGAEATLRTLAGNDVDQASLLIALLRASRASARYVQGVVEVPADDLAAMLGVRADKVGQALSAAGIANRPVARGGRIAAYAIEQVYVSAYVPLTNYRGTSADLEGRTWLPLAPALKPYAFTPAAGAIARAGVAPGAFLDAYLAHTQAESPLAALRRAVGDGLARLQPPLAYADQLARHDVAAPPLELLPASLPYPVQAVTGEFATLPEALRQHAHIVVRAGAAADSAVLLDATLPTSALLDRRITLSYAPASIDDGRIADGYGGLSGTPPYLVHVRPVLNVAGLPAANGRGEIDYGAQHRIEVTFDSPGGSAGFAQSALAGGLVALVLDGQADAPAQQADTAVLPGESESKAAQILANFGARYLGEWDAAERELADLVGVGVVRPLPSAALVLNRYAVDRVGGVIDAIAWKGVALDAAFHPVEPFAQSDNATAEGDWTRLSALAGSALEHDVFEQQWLVQSISADKGLQLAHEQNRPVLTLTAATGTGGVNQPQAVLDAIAGWLAQGYVVDVPRDPLTLQAWTGAVWRVTAPATGETGWFIAEALAGGSTAMPPELWYFQDLAEILANPYAQQPNDDPQSAVAVSLDASAQDQEGKAGGTLDKPLRAAVVDGSGRPVLGAQVGFTVVTGTAKLVAGGDESTQVIATTDNHGLAQVTLKLGTKQGNFGYYKVDPAQTYPQWVGANTIEVRVASAVGTLYSGEPYRAYTLPEVPGKLLLTGDPNRRLIPGVSYRTFAAVVEDQYDNEISNVAVSLSASTTYTAPNCGRDNPPHVDTVDATLFVPGQCPTGVPRLTGNACATPATATTTRPGGAPFFVVPPKTALATVAVQGSAGGQSQSLSLHTDDELVSVCREPYLYAAVAWVTVPFGGFVPWLDDNLLPIDAAPPGQVLPVQMRSDVFDGTVTAGDHAGVEWRPVENAVFDPQLTGGSMESERNLGNGTYLHDLRAGPDPAPIRGVVYVSWGNVQRVRLSLNPQAPQSTSGYQDTFGWSVKLDAPEVLPERVPLSPFSATDSPLRINVKMQPAEYIAAPLNIRLTEDGEVLADCASTLGNGTSYCEIGRGTKIDTAKVYKARVVVNDTNAFRMESPEKGVRFGQGIIAGYGMLPHVANDPAQPQAQSATGVFDELGLIQSRFPKRLDIRHDIDIPTGYACVVGTRFGFVLSKHAKVSLAFHPLDGNGDPSPVDAWKPLADASTDAGLHELAIGGDDLTFGDFQYELKAEDDDGGVESYTGIASHHPSRHDALPLAHPIVKGVDLYSGSGTLNETDVDIGGRGPGIHLARTYSTAQGDEKGYFGRGWSADLDSQVQVNDCNTRIVTGSVGQGQRYVADGPTGDGGWRYKPMLGQGFHGTLVQRGADYDFYSKDGTRYHYGQTDLAGPRLSYVEDTNGNRIAYTYELNQGAPRVTRIADAAGRHIDLTYVVKEVETHQATITIRDTYTIVSDVFGPGGLHVQYQYDDNANLVSVARVDGSASGSTLRQYAYHDYGGIFGGDPDGKPMYFRLGWRLESAKNALDGGTRSYAYTLGWSGVRTGDDGLKILYLPEERVAQLTEPDNGKTTYTYPEVRGLTPVTNDVSDARGKSTHYAMNRYGAAETVRDPIGATTTTVWDLLHLQPKTVTDAENTQTDYEYDEHGNRTSEIITHAAGTVRRTWSYYPPAGFDPPYIKNRVHVATDGEHHATTYAYDRRGNQTSVQRGDVTELDAYETNGDHASHTDGRGKVWTFRYDAFGYPREATDPLANTVQTTYDDRGRKTAEVDPRGARTTTTYDAQDRPLLVTLPSTPAGTATHETRYFDQAQQPFRIENDPLRHYTVSTFDRMGRLLSVATAAGTRVMHYDPNGNKLDETDYAGHPTTYSYDDANRLKDKHEPEGRTTTYTYDKLGHVESETVDGVGGARVTHYEYRHALYKRTLVRREADGGDVKETTRYDANGNPIEVKDALQRTTTLVYDARDRLTQRIEPLGRTTTYVYDGADHKVSETKANPAGSGAQVRQWVYDDAGRVQETIDAEGGHRTLAYDAAGNVVARSDARGNATTYTYDLRGHVLTEQGPEAGQTTTYGYDRDGNRIAETWANGRVLTYEYDDLDRRKKTSDTIGTVEELEYFPDGEVRRRVDADGNVTTYEYDNLRRLTVTHLPQVDVARDVQRHYNAHNDLTSEIDAGGHETQHSYDKLGRRRSTTLPPVDGQSASLLFDYDDVGNLTSQTDARHNATTFQVDDLNRRILQAEAGTGYTQTWTYDQVGNALTHVDRRGITTTTAYDKENRATSVVRDGLTIDTRDYDADGNVKVSRDALGRVITHTYDKAGRKTVEERPLGATLHWSYFPLGDVQTETDADGKETKRTYDERRRLKTEANAEGETTLYDYDGEGHRTLLRRPKSLDWTMTYDAGGRLKTVKDPLGNVSKYGYDADDNRTTIEDAEHHTTTFAYDERHRLKSRTYPATTAGTAVHQWHYDADGHVDVETTPNGNVLASTWDELGRRTELTIGNAPAGQVNRTTWVYDGNGNATTLTEYRTGQPARTETRRYDRFDRLEHVVDVQGRKLDYGYDSVGNRTRLRDADDQETVWTYDALNRNVGVTVPGQGTTNQEYFKSGRLQRVTRPDGSTSETTYDNAWRTLTLVHAKAGATIAKYAYRYDADGNRLEQRETNGGGEELTTYVYDDADRLTEVHAPDRTSVYTLDGVGNRTHEKVTAPAGATLSESTLTYNARDQLTARADSVLGLSLGIGYDADGNQTSQTEGALVRTFGFDARDRMVSLAIPATPPLSFDYDPAGLRIGKKQGGAETHYQYDQSSLVAEANSVGNTLARYHYGATQVLSRTEAGTTPVQRHYLLDALKSPIALITQDGTLSARNVYDAWGMIRRQLGTNGSVTTPNLDGNHAELPSGDGQSIGFTGYQKDGESGLYYAKARYYDPRLVRFIGEDPEVGNALRPPSLHRYSYAYGNPTIYVDPVGRIAILEKDASSAVSAFGDGSLELASNAKHAMADAPWYAKPGLAIAWAAGGVGYVASGVGHFVVGGANLGANAVSIAAAGAGDYLGSENVFTPLAAEARAEIDETVAEAAPVIDAIKADAAGTAKKAVVNTVTHFGEQVKGAWNGNDKDIFDLAQNLNPRKLLKDIRRGIVESAAKREAVAKAIAEGLEHGPEGSALRPHKAPEVLEHERVPVESSSGDGIATESPRTTSGAAVESAASQPPGATVRKLNPGTRFYVSPTGEVLDANTYARNSGFRKGVREEAWQLAVDPKTGHVFDPLSGKVMDSSKPWDMGHRPKMEYWKERDNAINEWLNGEKAQTRKQFLDTMNDPKRYRPELPESNRSHRGEDPSTDFEK